ncbi:UV-damage endonuclease Short=UVDE [Serendipita indica DSM 11827]|uniref:Related to UV-endonuclease UVE-1 n=1 Tax=Serendipita indica (strain DSM 11827) TaxID=1109443 RepID=G4TWL5_SERID|nr:UV-damage endonuclease Short=UVDE [Serendipita indica DSM 11827]CCA75708.1 related to UV-endonuclease UVE-1 [Serendipita indica DSM 11827]
MASPMSIDHPHSPEVRPAKSLLTIVENGKVRGSPMALSTITNADSHPLPPLSEAGDDAAGMMNGKPDGDEGEGGEENKKEGEEEEEEEEEFVPRRSTRVRKPVKIQPLPPRNSDSDSSDDEPVQRRRRRRKPKNAQKETSEAPEGEETQEGAEAVKKPARKRKRSTAGGPEEEDAEGAKTDAEQGEPVKKRASKKKKKEETDGEAMEVDGEGDATKQPRARKKSIAPVEGDGTAEGEDADEPAKPKRTRKPKVTEPVVYVIPDVERKTTTFRGRLGYACLNTVLRAQKPSIFSSRTCRLDTITKFGIDKVKELGRQNVQDLLQMIEWNEKNNIRFMRMSSEMFPFASHNEHGYDLAYCAEELKAVGDLAKKYGHRLTMHPGQFTQLASPKDNVVDQSIKELEYHAEIMDRMGLDQDSVMIIHMGGVYGDKATTLARFKENYQKKLSDRVKRRLVLENDEICYNADDLLKVCPELGIPIVFDYHHDSINPSRRSAAELIPLINETWIRRGIKPKQHLSQPRPGAVTAMELRAHADRCDTLPADLPDDMDLMIEAKDKEQAVFELYRIYGLHEVIHENLRPPAEDQGMRTKGRKSTGTSKKVKKEETAPKVEEQPIDPEMIDELADDDL